MKKDKSSQAQLKEYATDIRNEVSRWEKEHKEGCHDPFWPDGENLNLLHNHVSYDKGKIREICAAACLPFPAECFMQTPPLVSPNYFACPESERAKKIMSDPNWKCAEIELVKNAKFDTQLSFFCAIDEKGNIAG